MLGLTARGEFSELGKEPISPDLPSGFDVRYDPLFDQLQAEIDRGALPSQTGEVDWGKVLQFAGEILAHKSKDLQVAGYLAVGLIHTGGIDGLDISLQIFSDLLEYHGDGIFPQRERGRLRSVEWWLVKSETALKPFHDSAVDAGQLARMEENLGKFGRLLGELLQDPPSFQTLSAFLRCLTQSSGAERYQPPDAGGEEESAAAPGEKIPAVPNPSQAVQFDDLGVVEEGLRVVRETAAILRDRDVANPLAYRLSRAAIWLPLADLPPAKNALTLLPPPSSQLRNQLTALRRAGENRSLLQAVEMQLSEFIFWLDLNRMAAETLSDLGAQRAAAAVGEETSFLLRRLPGLDRLAFADETPFADADTRIWLQRLQPRGKIETVTPLPITSDSESERDHLFLKDMDSARALIDAGQLVEAVGLVQERLKHSRGERERLHWRLALSSVLLGAEQTRFALPLLAQLLSDVERFQLEQYEPRLALEVLTLARRGCLLSGPPFAEKADDILQRIARIDLAELVSAYQDD